MSLTEQQSIHLQKQNLSVHLENSYRLRDKFVLLIEKDSFGINFTSTMHPTIYIIAIAIEPLIQIILANIYGTQLQQKFIKEYVVFMVTVRCIVICIYFTLMRRMQVMQQKYMKKMCIMRVDVDEEQMKNKIQAEQMRSCFWVLLSTVVMFSFGSVSLADLIIGSKKNDSYTTMINNITIQEQIIFMICLCGCQIRYKYQQLLMRSLYIYYAVFGILACSQLVVTFICAVGTAFICELVWRRNLFFKKQQQNILEEFDQETQVMKENAQMQMDKILKDHREKQQGCTDSRADELLQTLRLLKYQKLVQKESFVSRKNKRQMSLCEPNIFRQQTGLISNSMQIDKSNNLFNQDKINSCTLIKLDDGNELDKFFQIPLPPKSEAVPIEFITPNAQTPPKDELILKLNDIDDLIKILTGQKNQIWLPSFLRSSSTPAINQINVNEQFSPEAKLFILDHFTEKEFNYNSHFDEVEEKAYTSNQGGSLTDYNFNCFDTTTPFIDYCALVFRQYNIYSTLKISSGKVMGEFLMLLGGGYANNPYHNSLHAMDVTNSVSYLLQCGLVYILSEFEIACLVISSMAHDIGHPGFNNGFMVATRSKQSLLYNDTSVLENYHASLLFHILKEERSNIVKNLEDKDWKGFRKYTMTLILDTDLQKHFQLLSKFKNILALGDSSANDESNRLLIMSIAIKAADVGHGAKSIDLHKLWSRRIIEEFFLQGDIELKMGLPVAPMCDRNLSVTKSQEGFLRAIVLPLFEAFNEYLMSERLTQVCIGQININIQYWSNQQKEEEEHGKASFWDDTNSVTLQIGSSRKNKEIQELVNQMIFS